MGLGLDVDPALVSCVASGDVTMCFFLNWRDCAKGEPLPAPVIQKVIYISGPIKNIFLRH